MTAGRETGGLSAEERETLVELLGEHRDDMESGDYGEILWSGCTCGDEHPYAEHDLHLADVILATRAAQPVMTEGSSTISGGRDSIARVYVTGNTTRAAQPDAGTALDEVERRLGALPGRGAGGFYVRKLHALRIVREVRAAHGQDESGEVRVTAPPAGTGDGTEVIEVVLAAHRSPVYGACSCGWITPSYLYGKTAAAWRSHVAAAIRAALTPPEDQP